MNWADNLRVGDRVIIDRSDFHPSSSVSNFAVATVARVTPTLVILDNDDRYSKKTLEPYPSNVGKWNRIHRLLEPTEENMEKVRKERIHRKCIEILTVFDHHVKTSSLEKKLEFLEFAEKFMKDKV